MGGKKCCSQSEGVGASYLPECGVLAVVRRPVPRHNTQISDVQSQGRDWPMSGPTHGAVIARLPGTRHRQSRPQLSCHACHKVRVSSHLSHLSQLPRYTPLSCQHIRLITPGVTPGGRPGPDTRQTPELPLTGQCPAPGSPGSQSGARSPWGS